MRTIILRSCLLVILGLATANAAVVYLKDGTQIRGTIVSATAQDVQISGAQGLQTIRTERISRIDYSEPETREATPQTIPPSTRYPREPRVRRMPFDGTDVWPQGREQFLSLGFGAAVPMSDLNFESTGGGHASNGGPGLHFSSQYLVRLNPRWGAGFEFNYLGRSERFTESLLPYSDTRAQGGSIQLMPILKYSLVEKGHARPYIAGGVGWHRSSIVVDSQPNLGFVWSDTSTDEVRTLVDDAKWGLATTARVGVDFSLFDPSVIGFEVGWTHMENQPFTPTLSGQNLGLSPLSSVNNAMTVTFRWGYRF